MSVLPQGIDIDEWRAALPTASAKLGPSTLLKEGPASLSFPSYQYALSVPQHALAHHQQDTDAQSDVPSLSSSVSTAPSSLHTATHTSSPTCSATSSSTSSQEKVTSKKEEADRLVDETLVLLHATWPGTCSMNKDAEPIPLRTFVTEILRRSRSSRSILSAAYGYLERAAVLLPVPAQRKGGLACARRTFLSSLILANKFLLDKVYSNRAWGKVSGLEVKEISFCEAALGDLLSWSLWVGREPTSTSSLELEQRLDANAPTLLPLADDPPAWRPKRALGPARAFVANGGAGAFLRGPSKSLPVASMQSHLAARRCAGLLNGQAMLSGLTLRNTMTSDSAESIVSRSKVAIPHPLASFASASGYEQGSFATYESAAPRLSIPACISPSSSLGGESGSSSAEDSSLHSSESESEDQEAESSVPRKRMRVSTGKGGVAAKIVSWPRIATGNSSDEESGEVVGGWEQQMRGLVVRD